MSLNTIKTFKKDSIKSILMNKVKNKNSPNKNIRNTLKTFKNNINNVPNRENKAMKKDNQKSRTFKILLPQLTINNQST